MSVDPRLFSYIFLLTGGRTSYEYLDDDTT